MIASRTCSVRPHTPDVGVAGPACAAALASPPAFTACNWNVYATSLARPVTTTQSSWSPPGALSSIPVHAAG